MEYKNIIYIENYIFFLFYILYKLDYVNQIFKSIFGDNQFFLIG